MRLTRKHIVVQVGRLGEPAECLKTPSEIDHLGTHASLKTELCVRVLHSFCRAYGGPRHGYLLKTIRTFIRVCMLALRYCQQRNEPETTVMHILQPVLDAVVLT